MTHEDDTLTLHDLIRQAFPDLREDRFALFRTANRMTAYPLRLKRALEDLHPEDDVHSVDNGTLAGLVGSLVAAVPDSDERWDTEVYFEIDRASLHGILAGTEPTDNLLYSFTATAVRFDGPDEDGEGGQAITVHITDAERARS